MGNSQRNLQSSHSGLDILNGGEDVNSITYNNDHNGYHYDGSMPVSYLSSVNVDSTSQVGASNLIFFLPIVEYQ